MSTPQTRSRELLLDEGYLVWTVESIKRFPDKKNPVPCQLCGAREMIQVKQDLFNAFDLLAVHPMMRETVFVQVTDSTNHSKRKNKVLTCFESKLLLLAGCRVMIHSWRMDRSINRWALREEEITLKDYESAPHYPNTVKELREIRRKEKKPDLPPGASLPFAPILDKDLPF